MLAIQQPMPYLEHGGDKFEYLLNVRRAGVSIATPNIDNWTISRWDIERPGEVFQPFEITVQAKNSIGTSNAAITTYTGYSYEGSM